MKKALWLKVWKKHQVFFWRSMAFLFLSYVLVPFALRFVSQGKEAYYHYNFYSFPAYTFLLVILFGVFHRRLLLEYRFTPSLLQRTCFLLLSIGSFSGYYWFRYGIPLDYTTFSWAFLAAATLYGVGLLGIALFIFGLPLLQKTFPSLLLFSVITFLFFVVNQLLSDIWEILAYSVAQGIYILLSFFSAQASLSLTPPNPQLGLGTFMVTIGPACSGIEGISLYLALFLLLIAYEQNTLDWKRTLLLFGIGLFGVYLLNYLRITLIMLLGTQYPQVAVGAFHSNAGWVLFSLFLLGLVYLGYEWMKKHK